jgi:hypothetical protein
LNRFNARGLLIALMMEAARTSETLVNFYQTTRRPEDSHLRTHRRENLKSCVEKWGLKVLAQGRVQWQAFVNTVSGIH